MKCATINDVSPHDVDSTDLSEAGWSCSECPRRGEVHSAKLECNFQDCLWSFVQVRRSELDSQWIAVAEERAGVQQ